VGVSRQYVRKIFEADQGDVLQPERIGDNYIVAVIAGVNKKGTMSVANAGPPPNQHYVIERKQS